MLYWFEIFIIWALLLPPANCVCCFCVCTDFPPQAFWLHMYPGILAKNISYVYLKIGWNRFKMKICYKQSKQNSISQNKLFTNPSLLFCFQFIFIDITVYPIEHLSTPSDEFPTDDYSYWCHQMSRPIHPSQLPCESSHACCDF